MAANSEALGLLKDLLRQGAEVSSKIGQCVSISSSVLPSVTSAADELGALRSIISQLEDNFQAHPNLSELFPHDALIDFHHVLTSCKKVFAQLGTAMHKFLGLEKGGAFAKMFLSWRLSFAEKDLAKILKALVAYKATLNITLLLTKSFITQGNSLDVAGLIDKFRQTARVAELDTPSDIDVGLSDVSSQSSQIFTPHTDVLSELDSTMLETLPVPNLPPAYQLPPELPVGKEKERSNLKTHLPIHQKMQKPARFVAPVKNKDHKPKLAPTASDSDCTLIEASRTGDTEMMNMMLMLEPNINAYASGSSTALSAAVISNKAEAVQLLLDRGADPNMIGEGFSALKTAVQYKHNAIGLLLLQRGANPNLEEKHSTAFCLAAHGNCIDFMAAMIKHGADMNVRQGEASAISIAARHGRPEIVQLLLDNGVDVNIRDTDGNFALVWAAYNGHSSIVDMLVKTPGIDINMGNNGGATALIDAAKVGHVETIQMLLKHGADANLADKRWGNSPLIWASWEGHAQRYTDSVKALLAVCGLDINHKNTTDGATALRQAATRGHIGALRLLLEAGADADIVDTGKNTPLIWAAYDGHLECVQALLDVPGGKAKINVGNAKGATALYDAATAGHEKVVAFLLEQGADPNVKGGADGSALMTAIKGRRTGIVKMLIAKGAKK